MAEGSSPTAAGSAVIEDGESFLQYGAHAQEVDGDLLAGRRWFEAAYQEGERAGDATVMARAVLGLSGLWLYEHRGATASGLLRARLRQVLRLVDPASSVAARLRLRLVAETDFAANRYDATLAIVDELRSVPDPAVRAEALRLALQCVSGPDAGELRRTLADELIGEAALGSRRTDLLMGLLGQVVELFRAGDPRSAQRLAELRAVLADGEHLAVGYAVRAIDVMLAIRAGQLAEAEQLAQDCLDRGSKAGDPNASVWYGAQLVAIRWYQGRLAELVPGLSGLVDAPHLIPGDNSFLAALAVAEASAGDHHAASRALAALRSRGGSDPQYSISWLVTMYGIVEAARIVGNAPAAARAYALLEPYAHLPMVTGHAVACFGSVHHALGVAASAMGDPDRAASHLREAVHHNLALGHWPALLASRLRFAEVLAARGQPGDAAAAGTQRMLAADIAAMLATGRPRAALGIGEAARCTRYGRRWRIELGTRVALVDHRVGLLHLAVLLANPGIEIAALELVAGLSTVDRAASGGTLTRQEVLDTAAVRAYRQRLADLDRRGGPTPERDWLRAELATATGPGGRRSAFPDNAERARVAVGRAIRRALEAIDRHDPVIGSHLRATVHTGLNCWYRP